MACEKQTVRRMAVGCRKVRHDDGKMGVVQTQRNAGGEVSCAADQNEHDTISPFRNWLARVGRAVQTREQGPVPVWPASAD